MDNINKCGVYSIYNKTTHKQYIGSTTMSFKKRFLHHLSRLRTNTHKNSYLQNAWNKYGELDFEFKIIDICDKSSCLKQEQIYLDKLNFLYNINPLASGTPNMSKETIEKRNNSIRKHWKTHIKIGRPAWNKGIPWSDEIKAKLKESAKNRKQSALGRLTRLNKCALRSKEILQYDKNMKLIKIWKSAKDINSTLKEYKIGGIRSCCNGSYKFGYYKDYIFKYNTAPLNSDIQKESDELGESLKRNNVMIIPSQVSTTVDKGVTTTGGIEFP